jgi:hypothetical protein
MFERAVGAIGKTESGGQAGREGKENPNTQARFRRK